MISTPKLSKHQSPAEARQDEAVRELDALFESVGLARNLRGKAAGVTRRVRAQKFSSEELTSAMPEATIAPNGVHLIQVKGWQKTGRGAMPWLWHGFSTRKGGGSRAYCAEDAPGDLNLGFTASDDEEIVTRNRRLMVQAVTGDADTALITMRQFHSSVLAMGVSSDAGTRNPHKADGLMTSEPGLLLGVQTADCIPVLVADRKRRVVAAFHAGWRGTAKRIVEAGVGRMRLEFGSRPEDLTAAIGPGIGGCCYAVGDEVLSSFESQFDYAGELFREVYNTDPVRTKYPMLFLTQRAPGHSDIGPSLHVDLVEANRRQLMAAGLRPRSIHLSGGCTSCHRELFFSHRASRGYAGRMMSVIGIRPR
jgi:YfiH family protein